MNATDSLLIADVKLNETVRYSDKATIDTHHNAYLVLFDVALIETVEQSRWVDKSGHVRAVTHVKFIRKDGSEFVVNAHRVIGE